MYRSVLNSYLYSESQFLYVYSKLKDYISNSNNSFGENTNETLLVY
jgi:hypothetical protein